MSVELPAGWVITPTLEEVPNPNQGMPFGTPYFTRWTYICTDGSGGYVCSSGSLSDCEAQAQSMAQSRVQQQPYYPSEPPGPPVKLSGWLKAGGPFPSTVPAAHDNTGFASVFDLPSIDAGIVDYVAEVIVWSAHWTPVGADPAPLVTPLPAGKVRVNWGATFPNFIAPQGLLVLSATVDGAPQASAIQIASSGGSYSPLAWGPVP